MTEQEKIRREKLEELKKHGINPYPAELFPVDNLSIDIIKDYFNKNTRAKRFLDKNNSSHELYDKNKEIYNSTLDHTKKYKCVSNLMLKIKKRQKKKKNHYSNKNITTTV